MDIILLESLNKLGKAGEIVTVKDGFAKNYLIPEKKAIIANKKNKADLESRIAQINTKNDNKIAAITSAIGIAFGNPKFHKITPINQII